MRPRAPMLTASMLTLIGAPVFAQSSLAGSTGDAAITDSDDCVRQLPAQTAGGPDSHGRRLYLVRMTDDEYIQHRLGQALTTAMAADSRNIITAVDRGVVTLGGWIGSDAAKKQAVAAARAIDGVREVNAELLGIMEQPPLAAR